MRFDKNILWYNFLCLLGLRFQRKDYGWAKVGSTVCPKTKAGLWLSKDHTSSTYSESAHNRPRHAVLDSTAVVKEVKDILIDYTTYPSSPGCDYKQIGILKFRDCFVESGDITGWVGEGSLIPAEDAR